MTPTNQMIKEALGHADSLPIDTSSNTEWCLQTLASAYRAKCAEVEELRKALKLADEAMGERRSYAADAWGWKYGETWDEEDAIIAKALEGKE